MLVGLDLADDAHHLPLVLPQLRGVHAGRTLLVRWGREGTGKEGRGFWRVELVKQDAPAGPGP